MIEKVLEGEENPGYYLTSETTDGFVLVDVALPFWEKVLSL